MYLLGTVIIICGIAAALLATISYALVPFGRVGALVYGRVGTRAALVAVLAVVGLLNYLFVTQRYDIDYVYNYSSLDLEPAFRAAAVWAGQPGSFVIWALWGVIAAQLLVRRTKHAEPYVLSVFMFIQAALLIFMLIRNPFVPHLENGIPVTPLDGKGLNATLHNFWMLIHPPILFVGFALMAVPFAFAIGGLWRRDYDGWVRDALPWTIAAWSFLGLALLLGGYWAYETLGWGGYWGWDPVENSALVPWLVSTALIHTMLVQKSGGGLRRAAFALAMLTYILVFYSTFLTRSGVLSSFSVHSFVEEGLKTVMYVALGTLTAGSLGVLAWRWRDIPGRPLSDKLLSRESFFLLGIFCLMTIAVVVSLGTSMPIISSIGGIGHTLQDVFNNAFKIDDGTVYGSQKFADGRFGLIGDFYSSSVPPLGLILVILLIVGPLLGWRDSNLRNVLKALRIPAVLAILAASAGLVIGARSPLAVAYVGLATFAIGSNVLMIIRTMRGGWLRIGGYLAHVGLMLLLVGAAASSWYATPEQRIQIARGQEVSIYGYSFVFDDYVVAPNGRGQLNLTVTRGNEVWNATPQLYFNQKMGGTMATPSIKSELFRDVYVSPQEYQPSTKQADMAIGETQEIGPYTVKFVDFMVPESHSTADATLGAKLEVTYQGKTTEVIPQLIFHANEKDVAKAVEFGTVTLPGGHLASLGGFDPTAKRARVMVQMGEPTAVVTVTVKPGVMLVWIGVVVGVIGGALAVVRRTLEGVAQREGARFPIPRGLLGRLVGQKEASAR